MDCQMNTIISGLAAALALLSADATAQTTQDGSVDEAAVSAFGTDLPQVLLHPIYDEPSNCSEHGYGTLKEPGDAMGQDCLVLGGIDFANNSGFMASFRGDGLRNEDWYGWGKPVLSPLSGTVIKVHANDIVNEPGVVIPGRAASVVIQAVDGTSVVLAHLGSFAVAEGDKVRAGQVVGTVGNNGFSRSPHIHVGAITADGEPAQIRWNLAVLGLLARDFITRMREEAVEQD